MKEFHAYLNQDGTYRIDGIVEMFDNGQFIDTRIKAARAKVSVEFLATLDSNELYTVIVEDTLVAPSEQKNDKRFGLHTRAELVAMEELLDRYHKFYGLEKFTYKEN